MQEEELENWVETLVGKLNDAYQLERQDQLSGFREEFSSLLEEGYGLGLAGSLIARAYDESDFANYEHVVRGVAATCLTHEEEVEKFGKGW